VEVIFDFTMGCPIPNEHCAMGTILHKNVREPESLGKNWGEIANIH